MGEIEHRAVAASVLPAPSECVAGAGREVGEEGGAVAVSFNPSTQDGAAAQGQIAVQAWRARGAIGVGYEVYQLPGGDWTYRITGLNGRLMPIEGMKRA